MRDTNEDPTASAADQPVRRPREVVAAIALSAVAAVLWLPVSANLSNTGLVAPALLIYIGCVVWLLRGRAAARTAVSILGGLLCVLLGPYIWLGFDDPDNLYGAEDAVVDMVAVAACVAGIALLYRPNAAEYFRAIEARRTG